MEEPLLYLFVGAIWLISTIIGKVNQRINKKRMEVNPRHIREAEQRDANQRKGQVRPDGGRAPAQSSPATSAPRPAAKKPDLAEIILQQLEATLPPEVARARQEARQAARKEAAKPAEKPVHSTRPQMAPRPDAAQPRKRPVPVPRQPRIGPSRIKPALPVAAGKAAAAKKERRPAPKVPAVTPSRRSASWGGQSLVANPLRASLGTRAGLRQAILMHEILGAPIADREPGARQF
jgi:hypothetical protein